MNGVGAKKPVPADNRAVQLVVGFQRRPCQGDFQGRDTGRVADQGVPYGQRETVRRSTDRNSEVAMTGPAEINHQGLQTGRDYF